MSTKKTMMVPCIVTRARYCSGVMTWPHRGILCEGHASWKRMSNDRNMPTKTATRASHQY